MGRRFRTFAFRLVGLLLPTVLAAVPSGCGAPSVKPFELFSVDGQTSYASDSFKGKYLMLDYWATWCGPCRKLQPTIREISDMYSKRGLVVLGVTDEAPKTVADFVKQHPLGYTPVIDRGDRVSNEFAIDGLPTVILLDKNGAILFKESAPDVRRLGAILEREMPTGSTG